ncbi:MAG: alpha/beta hydrolase [Abditibacteriaceae bacterium]
MQEKSTPLRLWPNDASGALGQEPHDIPTLTPYFPDTKIATGAAMLICPGGGYANLAAHEGEDYALFLNTLGITAFVLQYRLGNHGYRHPAMMQDAARGVRTIRANATEWNIQKDKIGIMGSSAGGHLAATLLTHYDEGNSNSDDSVERESSRPDLGILCYAVITMGEHTHQGSRQNLLGENPSPEFIEVLSNELHVNAQTPPCFLWHTWEDEDVELKNSLDFVAALQKYNVPFDFHVYQKGTHGLGLADKPPFTNVHPWAHDLKFWLQEQQFVA